MERISELLDALGMSAGSYGTSNDVVYRWAVETTNRIQELQAKVELLESKLNNVMEHHGLSEGL